MTRLWIFSDPHFEMGNNIPASAPDHDVCVVAGDLISWSGLSSNWPVANSATPARRSTFPAITTTTVRNSMEGAERLATEKVKGTNVFLANPDEYVFNGTRFLGCTLWTDYKLYGDQMRSMGHAGSGMMDHRLIMTEDHSDYFVHTMPSTPFAYENRNRPPTSKTSAAAPCSFHRRTCLAPPQARVGVAGRAFKGAVPRADCNLQPPFSVAKISS